MNELAHSFLMDEQADQLGARYHKYVYTLCTDASDNHLRPTERWRFPEAS
jgi:hypothetical protein